MDTTTYTTNDVILLSQFNDWRFGQYERPCEANEVIKELNYHPHNRSHFEIWQMALKCLKKAESNAAKLFYKNLAAKHREHYIYSL